MQPQDNNFPIDQITTDGQAAAAGNTGLDDTASQPDNQTGSLEGGATFSPQTSPQDSAPAWQQDAQADTDMLSTQAPNDALGAGQIDQPTFAPPADTSFMPVTPDSTVAPEPSATLDMPLPANPTPPQVDPTMSDSYAAVTPIEGAMDDGSMAPGVSAEPMPATATEPMPAPAPEPMLAPAPEPMPATATEPILAPAPEPLPPSYAQPEALPGAANLGAAVSAMNTMGTPGPAPKKSKKMIFIILGIVLGLVLVGGGVYYFAVIAKKSTPAPTTTPDSAPTPTPTPSSGSGPATPPEGYATITKQCYSFAIFIPNSVPTDENCSFGPSTFGQKAISTIAVDTKTEPYQKIDEYLAISSASVTVLSTDVIKLDGLDATQVIYKATDGKTYSLAALLLVGKNYQQDGKTVTVVAITTTYQDEFDKTVTKNILDTWRWQ